MADMIIYIIKSTVYLTVFYAFFMLVMRKTTFFRLNRVMFMAETFICMLLPLMNIRFEGDINTPMAMLENVLNPAATQAGTTSDRIMLGARTDSTADIIGILFLAGAFASSCVTASSYLMMRKMMKCTGITMIDGHAIRITDSDIPSFSWGRDIVIGRKDLEKNPAVLTHEMMHVRCGHSYDLIAYAVVTTLQWFNPLVWIARKELKMLHEYEADELTIREGIDAAQYQLLLVQKAVGEKRFQLANGFNRSKLKNRISMMHKEKSSRWMKLSYILCIPMLAAAMCCCSEGLTETETRVAPVPYSELEVKPRFQGQDDRAFSKWINMNLIYPKEAKEKNIQGRVMAGFTIDERGKITDIRILNGADPLLDKEALRVLSLSPDWEPGRVDGKAVPVSYSFPVIFLLRQP